MQGDGTEDLGSQASRGELHWVELITSLGIGIWAAGWWCQSPKRGTIRTGCRLVGSHEHGGWEEWVELESCGVPNLKCNGPVGTWRRESEA